MSIDVTRYALLTAEYRYVEQNYTSVGTTYSKAKVLEILSKFQTTTGIASLVSLIGDVMSAPKRRLELTVSGTDVLSPDSFTGTCPTVRLTYPFLGINNERFAVTRMVVNEENNSTVLELWGGMN
jgi:hypothetical protein